MTLDFRDIVRLVLKLDEGLFMNLNSIISNQLNHEKSVNHSNNQWLNTMQTPLHLHLNKTQWSKQMRNLTATVQGKELSEKAAQRLLTDVH